MHKLNNIYRFFGSALTVKGFVSYLGEIKNFAEDTKTVLIKGGAGSGKSTFIKRAVKQFSKGEKTELICCSLDPQSLDGALIKNKKLALIDATPPHNIEPSLIGINEDMVSLYDFFDSNKLLLNKPQILKIKGEEDALKNHAQSLVCAAGMLLSSNESIAARALDALKLANYTARLCMREVKGPLNKKGRVHNRFLTALTQDGVLAFTDTAEKICNRIYVIEDDLGAVSNVILDSLCKTAVQMGYDVYACRCPMSLTKRIDHLLIPELSLGFMTSNKFHPICVQPYKTIRSGRFFSREILKSHSQRLRFQKKAARELLNQASQCIGSSLIKHNELEKFYNDACDFKAREEYVNNKLAAYI